MQRGSMKDPNFNVLLTAYMTLYLHAHFHFQKIHSTYYMYKSGINFRALMNKASMKITDD